MPDKETRAAVRAIVQSAVHTAFNETRYHEPRVLSVSDSVTEVSVTDNHGTRQYFTVTVVGHC